MISKLCLIPIKGFFYVHVVKTFDLYFVYIFSLIRIKTSLYSVVDYEELLPVNQMWKIKLPVNPMR